MKIPPTTVQQCVGECPVCRVYLWAEVDVQIEVSGPHVAGHAGTKQTVTVNARPVLTAMRLSHECKRDDAEAPDA